MLTTGDFANNAPLLKIESAYDKKTLKERKTIKETEELPRHSITRTRHITPIIHTSIFLETKN